jgi:ribonucleoside-diphosphate reductase alpha chain
MIPFESQKAADLNKEIFACIQERALKASTEMATIYGEPELLR